MSTNKLRNKFMEMTRCLADLDQQSGIQSISILLRFILVLLIDSQ